VRLAHLSVLGLLLPGAALAFVCPPQPQQVAREWQAKVEASVGRIGPITGGNFDAQANAAAKDLFEKLPNADKVYLEQMMFAAYCSSLRDDRVLSEAEKREALVRYSTTMRQALVSAAATSPYSSLQVRTVRRVAKPAPKPQPRALQGPDLKAELDRYAGYLEGQGDTIAALFQARNMPKEREEFLEIHRRRLDAVRSGNLVEADRLSSEIRHLVSDLLPETFPRWTYPYPPANAGAFSAYQATLVLNYLETVPADEPLVDFLRANQAEREQ